VLSARCIRLDARGDVICNDLATAAEWLFGFFRLYEGYGGKAMAQDWPMFIMQCVVLAAFASVFFVRGEGD
jgi:hypothetical protein